MNKIKNGISNFYNNYGITLLILILTSLSAYYICMVDIIAFEIPKQTMFYKGASVILILCLILRKPRLYKNLGAIAVFLVYAGHAANWLYDNREGWGPELFALMIWKYVAIGLVLPILMDIVKNGVGVSVNKKSVFFWITLIAFSGAFILEPDFTIPIIVPCLFFYTVPFTKKNWDTFEISFPVGIILTFVYVMTKAIVNFSDNYAGERFYGISGIAQDGALCGLAFVSIIFLFYKNLTKYKSIMTYILLGALFIYSGYFLLIVQSRSGLLGAFATFIVFIAVYFIRNKKTFFICLFSILGTVIVAFTGLFIKYKQCINNNQPVSHLLGSFRYFNAIFDESVNLNITGDLNPANRFLNSIDQLFSSRLSVWYCGFKQTTLLGKNPTFIIYGQGNLAVDHAHCSFVDWIVRYGWIVGILLNIWFIYLFVSVFRKSIKTHELNFLFFAVTFCLVYTFFDVQYWNRAIPFSVLLLQYSQLIPKFIDETPLSDNNKVISE